MKYALDFTALSLSLGACTTNIGGEAKLTPLLVANQQGDADLSCEEISTELDKMNVLLAESEQGEANAEATGAVAGTATNAAVNTALYSGALSRVPGLGMVANAAGGIAQQRAKAEAEKQAENARRAELRRTALTGIAAGKGC